MTRFALRGAIGFGLTALIAFSLAVLYARTAPLLQADYFMVAGLICGVAGGLAYGRRWGLPLVFGVNLGLVAYLFGLQDARLLSPSDVLYTGLATAFVFWLVGGCAVLALPSGSEIKILSLRGNWIYAALPNDLRGWIPAESAERVRL